MDVIELKHAQNRMIESELSARGIVDERVLQAFRDVPRESFVPEALTDLAYRNAPLPIGEEQTISQPYIVALTAQALRLSGRETVLEIGTGSGYAAAILSRLAKRVFGVERIPTLAETARERLARLEYPVEVLAGDGTLGWPEHAPFDAVAVAACGPVIPRALIAQLKIGGRMVIPVGERDGSQKLMKVVRISEHEHSENVICEVRFVPLIGAQGWDSGEAQTMGPQPRTTSRAGRAPRPGTIASLVREASEPIDGIESQSLGLLLDRIGDSRLVLIGESTHGTSEFYRMRDLITRELIQRRGFSFVAVEADWPDAARIDDYVLGGPPRSNVAFTPFQRFPTWMWANREVDQFIGWLREHNARIGTPDRRVGFHGLDLYSMFTSIAAVLGFLDSVDSESAAVARSRYGLLTPWQEAPEAYGQAVMVGRYESCQKEVVKMLCDLLARRLEFSHIDSDRFFDAAQNARLVADAERYYRTMYYGHIESWNLRDSHMFETLKSLFGYYGNDAKGIVWEHNSHVGDDSATEMGKRGEHNVGQLSRAEYKDGVYIIGMGTDHGHVAAASNWDEPMQRMEVRPSDRLSYESIFHESGSEAFTLPLRNPRRRDLREELASSRLQRAIGVVYRPETEMQSHYYYTTLPDQFDEYMWFDETDSVTPLVREARAAGTPETYPFGL